MAHGEWIQHFTYRTNYFWLKENCRQVQSIGSTLVRNIVVKLAIIQRLINIFFGNFVLKRQVEVCGFQDVVVSFCSLC